MLRLKVVSVRESGPEPRLGRALPSVRRTPEGSTLRTDIQTSDAHRLSQARRIVALYVRRAAVSLQYGLAIWATIISTPAEVAMRIYRSFALLAQLVEHFHGKEGVAGSSPAEGS
jgi:hypothetical protein